MRSLLLAGTFLSAFVQAALANPTADGPTVAELRKRVVEGYAKHDRLRMSCWGCANAGSGSTIVAFDYHFDRRTKRLAIRDPLEGVLYVLVKGNQVFLSLGCHKEGVPTYLEINKDRPITWRDVDQAAQLIRKQFDASGAWLGRFPFSTTCCSFGTCFVAPFLEGGMEKLFSQETKVLHVDRKLFNLPENEAAAKIVEASNFTAEEVGIFWVGHPDGMLMPPSGKQLKLDPNRFPICFKTEDDSSSWLYAFDPETGTLSAAWGTVDHERVYGSPGNKITILMKKTPPLGDGGVGKEDDGVKPIPLDLPRGARTIGTGDLRRYCVEVISQLGLATILEAKAKMEQDLQKAQEEESDLLAKISEESATSRTDGKGFEDIRAELAIVRSEQQTYRHVIAEIEKLIEEIRESKEDSGSAQGIRNQRRKNRIAGYRGRRYKVPGVRPRHGRVAR